MAKYLPCEGVREHVVANLRRPWYPGLMDNRLFLLFVATVAGCQAGTEPIMDGGTKVDSGMSVPFDAGPDSGTPVDAGSTIDSGTPVDAGSPACSRAALEGEMFNTLSTITTDVDFTLHLERGDDVSFQFSRGTSTFDTEYESASTSKMITAAIILWVVEGSRSFNLDSHPGDYLPSWSGVSRDIDNITLAHLLSFTSGLSEDQRCMNLGLPINGTFDECIADILSGNLDAVPGVTFNYGSSHMQVAGAMAIAAGGYSDWQALFTAYKAATGLFGSSVYNKPRRRNPRLAGGMTWTGRDYVQFLRALQAGELLSEPTMALMFSDQIGTLRIEASPAEDIDVPWHYGFGLWLECPSLTTCDEAKFFSSPGAYGAYPFLHPELDFVGLLARQGGLASFRRGIAVIDAVRSDMQAWAACPAP